MTDSAPDRASAPHRTDARRNRQRLIEAATRCIAGSGGDTSMAAVASLAGVGEATLFRHFASRTALYEAVATLCLEESEEAVATAAAMDVRPGFKFLVEHFAQSLLRNRNLELVAADLMARPEVSTRQQDVVDAAGAMLAAGQRTGVIHSDVLLEDLLTALQGIAVVTTAETWQRPLSLLLRGVFVDTDST